MADFGLSRKTVDEIYKVNTVSLHGHTITITSRLVSIMVLFEGVDP